MNIALLCFTDGRADCLLQTMQSFEQRVSGMFNAMLMIDDSGNPGYAKWLDQNFSSFAVVHNPERLGFTKTIQVGFDLLPAKSDYVFWLEDDFTFNRAVNVDSLVRVLESHAYLAQVSLKRQAVNSVERAAGGIVELNPNAFSVQYQNGTTWLEHSQYFTTNPSLVPYRVTRFGWPQAKESEGKFGAMLKANGYRFAMLGDKFDPPMVEHIGRERVGIGY